jgi:hypothetical protein
MGLDRGKSEIEVAEMRIFELLLWDCTKRNIKMHNPCRLKERIESFHAVHF